MLPLALSADRQGGGDAAGLPPPPAKAPGRRVRNFSKRPGIGEKGHKRMAEVACVFDVGPPAADPGARSWPPARQAAAATRAAGAWVTAAITAGSAAIIAALVDEAGRRDPGQAGTGSSWQTATTTRSGRPRRGRRPASPSRSSSTSSTCWNTCWKAAWSFFDKGEPAAEEWVADQARKILHGKARQVAAGIRRRATAYGYSGGRARRRRRVRPLPGQQAGLPGLRHRAQEGLAHRHRDHRRLSLVRTNFHQVSAGHGRHGRVRDGDLRVRARAW